MDGHAMLKRAMKNRPYKRIVNNKMRGLYGETDTNAHIIRINKTLAKKHPLYKRPVNKGASKYPDVLGTIAHEEYHAKHPKATEKTVRRKERVIVKKMSPAQKKRMYGRFSK